MNRKSKHRGIRAALFSALFLGSAPVLGKQAILFGFSPLAVVALRTLLAASLLFAIMYFTRRPFLYIYPVGLMGCLLAGGINGIGSVFYYLALGRLNAGLAQLLYATYPLFVALWLILDAQPPSKLTIIRAILALIATGLMTAGIQGHIDWLGIGMMLIGAALYALHIPINQRILYEIPAPTVTLYTLISMALVVVPAYLIFDHAWPSQSAPLWPIIGLGLVTVLSRITLFIGVKNIGGMQTALLGLAELLVTLLGSYFWLHEHLSLIQWLGALLLAISLLLVYYEKGSYTKPRGKGGWLSWLRPPESSVDLPSGLYE